MFKKVKRHPECSKCRKTVWRPQLHMELQWGRLQRSHRSPAGGEGACCPSPKTPSPFSALQVWTLIQSAITDDLTLPEMKGNLSDKNFIFIVLYKETYRYVSRLSHNFILSHLKIFSILSQLHCDICIL